jgi:hypothetical protein
MITRQPRTSAIPVRTPPCRDPSDVAFLQLAIVGKADYLVTGDKDLLSLSGRIRCRIVKAEALLAFLERVDSSEPPAPRYAFMHSSARSSSVARPRAACSRSLAD